MSQLVQRELESQQQKQRSMFFDAAEKGDADTVELMLTSRKVDLHVRGIVCVGVCEGGFYD